MGITKDLTLVAAMRKSVSHTWGLLIQYNLNWGIFWTILGAVMARGFTLTGNILVARIVGKLSYGQLGIIQSTVVMAGIFAGLGLGATCKKYIAELRQKDPIRAGRIIALVNIFVVIASGLISIMIYIFAPWIASSVLNEYSLTYSLRISTFLIFLSAIIGSQAGIMIGLEAFKENALWGLISSALTFPSMLIGATLYGIDGVLYGLILGALINFIFNKLAIDKKLRQQKIVVDYSSCSPERTLLWKYSLPATLVSSLMGPVTWICNAILVNSQNGFMEMGALEAANQGRLLILFLPGTIAQVFHPKLSNLSGSESKNEYRSVFKLIMIVTITTAGIIAIPLICFSEQLMQLYGKDYEGSGTILLTVSLAAVLKAINDSLIMAYFSKGYMWYAFLVNLLWGCTFIILTYYFIFRCMLGANGYAIALFLSYVPHIFFQYRLFEYLENKDCKTYA